LCVVEIGMLLLWLLSLQFQLVGSFHFPEAMHRWHSDTSWQGQRQLRRVLGFQTTVVSHIAVLHHVHPTAMYDNTQDCTVFQWPFPVAIIQFGTSHFWLPWASACYVCHDRMVCNMSAIEIPISLSQFLLGVFPQHQN
jgi:hypothetical protein